MLLKIKVYNNDLKLDFRLQNLHIFVSAGGDENSLLYVAMVMLTVGKILRNLGLVEEVSSSDNSGTVSLSQSLRLNHFCYEPWNCMKVTVMLIARKLLMR